MPEEVKEDYDYSMKPDIPNVVQTFQQPVTKLNQREKMKEELFKPSWTQPKMTLDEHSDLEYALMMNKQ